MDAQLQTLEVKTYTSEGDYVFNLELAHTRSGEAEWRATLWSKSALDYVWKGTLDDLCMVLLRKGSDA